MAFQDKVINFLIRGRDFFTPEAKKSGKAMEEMKATSARLNAELKTLRDTSKELAKASELEQYSANLKTSVDEAQAALADLSDQLKATPGASQALKDAVRDAGSEVDTLKSSISRTEGTVEDLGRALRRGGVDMTKLGEEQARLTSETAALTRELQTLKRAQGDALKLGELRTNVGLAKTEFEGAEKKLKALAAQLDATNKPTRELKDAHRLAANEAGRASTSYQKLSRDLAQHEASVTEAGIATDDLTKTEQELANAIGTAQLKLAELTKTQKALSDYDKLTPQLERQRAALVKNQQALADLRTELNQATAPQKALAEQVAKAAQLAGKAQIAYEKNEAKLAALRQTLALAGIDANDFAGEQQRLANAQARAAAEADKQGGSLKDLRKNLDNSAQGAANFTGNMRGMLATLAASAGAYIGLDKLWDSFKSVINVGGDFETLREQLIGVYGDVQQGAKAFEWAVNLNQRLPTSLDDVLQAFVMLKNNGMDPMNGTLEKLIYGNVRYGKGAETMIPIIRQLTQSWGKNRLQAEEAYVLIENGLPVWQLLSEKMNLSIDVLMKMSEQGKLTRNEIKLLFDAMGEAGEGVIERRMLTWNTLVTKFRDGLKQAQDQIAQSGALDYLKTQLQEVNKEMAVMAADGRLAKFGAEFADWTRSVVEGGKELATTLYDWRGGIELVAKAWLMFKAIGMVKDVSSLATAVKDKLVMSLIAASEAMHMTGSSGKRAKQSLIDMTGGVGVLGKAMGTLGNLITGLVGSLGFGGIIVATAAAGTALVQMAKDIYAVTVETDRHAAAAERQRAALAQQAASAAALMAQYSRYKETVQLTAEQISFLNEAERQRYQEALAGQREYLLAQEQHNVLLKLAGQLTREQELATSEGLKKVEAALAAFAKGTELAMVQAGKSIDDYVADIEHAKSVAQGLADGSLGKVFTDAGLDLEQLSGKVGKVVDDFGKGLDTMAQASSMNAEAIQGYLAKAFDSTKNRAEIQLLLDKMQVLHDQGKLVGEPWIQSLNQATEAAKKLSEESVSGSDLYIQLLNKQKAAADAAYKAGKISAEQHTRAVGSLNQEITKTTKELNKQQAASSELNDAYTTLGVTSAKTLDKQAEAAKKAYAAIASTSGKIEEQKVAFLAYAEAQLKADKANGRFSDGALIAQAMSLGLTDQLKALTTSINTTGSAALITAGALDKLGATSAKVQTQAEAAMQYQSASTKAQTENIKQLEQGTRSATGTMVQFANQVVSSNDLAGLSLDQLRAKMAEYQNVLARSREYLHKSNDEWWSDQVRQQLAAERTNKAITEQMIQFKALVEQLNATENPSAELIAQGEQALQGFTRLDKTTLSGLRSAIDAAKQKMEALSDAAHDTLGSLQDELDQYNDNLAAVEERRYQNQVADLQAKLAEAQAAKNSQAIADYQQAIRLAQQLHDKKMADIAEEKASKAAEATSQQTTRAPVGNPRNQTSNNQPGQSPAPTPSSQTQVIRIEMGGKSATVQADPREAANLKDMLGQLGQAKGVTG